MDQHFKEIEDKLLLDDSLWVYTDGLSIDYEDIESLLNQEKQKIIHDMELIINDAVNNPRYYINLWRTPEGAVTVAEDFLLTSLMVLADIEAENSFPLLLKVLSQDSEWLDRFLALEFPEMHRDIIIHLGKNKLDELCEFALIPGTDTWIRAMIGEATEQLALNFPEYRKQVIQRKERILSHYTSGKTTKSGKIIDHAGMTVWSLINLGSVDSLPLFKKVFEQDLIENNLVGDYVKAEEDTRWNHEKNSEGYKKEIMKIADRHAWYWEQIQEEVDKMRYENEDLIWDEETVNDIHEEWSEEDFEPDSHSENMSDYKDTKFDHLKVSRPSVPRRNDPCTCGSGKKYKNCCMLKDLNPGLLN